MTVKRPELLDEQELGALLPQVRVPPPGPRSRELARRLSAVEAPTGSAIARGEVPVFWDQTHGANVTDVDGNRYIDLTAGYCVALVGHSHPRIAAAVAEQAQRMMHSQGASNPNEMRVRLAEKLAEVCPGDLSASHIASTGAEAVEMAIKTARLYTGRHTIVAFQGGFHGKTMGALAVTSQNYYREPFVAGLPGAIHLPYPYAYRCPLGHSSDRCRTGCADYLEHVLTYPDSGVADVAAIIVEPVQGHGGWIVPPKEFMQRVRTICDRQGIVMIADEIIVGFGRTGRLWACEHFDVVPDILVTGKGLASGFPISAMVTRREIANAWKPLQHTSTFLGNPMGCAAALASIAEIQERGLVQRSAELGTYFKERVLELAVRHETIGDVRGLGMMVAIEVVEDRETKRPGSELGRKVVDLALAKGIMATNYGGSYHNVIKMSPPLVITHGQIDYAVNALDECFGEVEATR
jgi:4-aminobutyrate aminotransferase